MDQNNYDYADDFDDEDKTHCDLPDICEEGKLDDVKSYFNRLLQESFVRSCQEGRLDVAKWLTDIGHIDGRELDVHVKNDLAFRMACRKGHLNVVKWLEEVYSGIGDGPIKSAFVDCCGNKLTEVAEWLNETYDVSGCLEKALIIACGKGHIELAKWIHSLGKKSLIKACENGDLTTAKWVSGLGEVNIHADNDQAFVMSCWGGYLDVAKWLHGLGGIDTHARNEEAFIGSIWSQNEEMTDWLYGFGNVNVHAKSYQAFYYACQKGNLKQAQWLYGLSPVKFREWADTWHVFCPCCWYGHLDVLKWLSTLDGFLEAIDIRSRDSSLFDTMTGKTCCTIDPRCVEVTKWLTTLNPDYQIEVEDGKIVGAKYTGPGRSWQWGPGKPFQWQDKPHPAPVAG